MVFVASSQKFFFAHDFVGGPVVDEHLLGLENFTAFQIDRVDVSAVPVFYLKNGSVFVFGLKSRAFFCGIGEPAAGKFMALNVLNVTRFCPYARLDGSGGVVSTYLKAGRVFYCSGSQKVGKLDYEYGKSVYFDYYESESSKLMF